MASSERMLALRLLGPPELRRDGAALTLPVRKLMALLLVLARDGSPVPRARVASMLWPDLDESTGRRNLRRELARLRETGASDAVRVDGDTLAAGDALDCDAVSFAAAVDAGLTDDALALWRGAPADGFSLGDSPVFDDWLDTWRDQLSALRHRALRASAVAREAAGDATGALDRIEALLADDPLQEQHHRDAMRLLAACGRRGQALARYERCRVMLRDELGLAPTEETEALASALRGSAAAPPLNRHMEAPAPPVPLDGGHGGRAFIPKDLPFVGRDEEVQRLEAGWADRRPAVIEGVGGIGKSRLATDFAAAHGPFALARCRMGDAELPYASFARALRSLMGPVPELPPLPNWVADELTRLVPELGPAPPPIRSDEERNRFFEACALGWRALSADSFDAIVLDDWHLADAASRALLAFIVRRRAESGDTGTRELFVLRPDLDEAAATALRNLIDDARGVYLVLQPLGGEVVLDLIARLAGGGRPARFAARLEHATGGNPFFIAETLRHLVEAGHLASDETGAWHTPFDADTEDYRELPVPASVREAVLGRVRRLPAATRRVLEAASLAAEPFQPALLAPACALSELDTVLAIEVAVGAALLREHPSGGFGFVHDLIQHSLAAALPAERARLVHRRLALGAEGAGASPAAIAAHHEASGNVARAVTHRVAAGDLAQRLHALPEAIGHWRKALADGAPPALAIDIHERLIEATSRRTEWVATKAEADALGAMLQEATLTPAQRAGATALRGLALARSDWAQPALDVLDAAEPPRDLDMLTVSLTARALALRHLGRVDEALAVVHEALAPDAIADARRIELLEIGYCCENDAGRAQRALALADATLALSRRLGDEAGVARGLFYRSLTLLVLNDFDAERGMLESIGIAERLGLIGLERMSLFNLTNVYSAQGLPAKALAAAQRGWALQPPMPQSDMRVMYRLALLDAHHALGELGEARTAGIAAAEEVFALDQPMIGMAATMCAIEPLALVGEIELARRLIDAVDPEAMRSIKATAGEMLVALAQFELKQGRVDAAERALAEVASADEYLVVARVKVRHAQAQAELALAHGDAAGALRALPDDADDAMNDELRIRGLALRIAAEASSGTLSAASVETAMRWLSAPTPHHTATLELLTALARAAIAEVAGAPAAALGEHAACVDRLAASLAADPVREAAFHDARTRELRR